MTTTRRTRKGTKQTTRKKAAPRKPVAKRPDAGPVTLDEARALAGVTHPAVVAHGLRRRTAPPGSPAALGAERRRLRKERKEEIKKRVRDYKATLAIMKARGARAKRKKATKPKTRPAGPTPKTGGAFTPLQILAEGDSWFDYPVPFFGGGIVPRLEDLLGVPILNLAKAGDEVRYMLGVDERTELAKHLTNGCPAGGPWDVVLFSGGGNDIVDNPMALWVKDWDPTLPPAAHLNQPRFDSALALVRAGYEDLITLRDQLCPGTQLVFHGYDFAIPDGRGICFLGPWLKPTFDLRKFPGLAPRIEVVKAMLLQFAAMLTSLTSHPRVSFIDGQGTLAPQTSSWHNELHPSRAGFDAHTQLFYERLKTLFPNRVG